MKINILKCDIKEYVVRILIYLFPNGNEKIFQRLMIGFSDQN